jgi:hypothetical protein
MGSEEGQEKGELLMRKRRVNHLTGTWPSSEMLVGCWAWEEEGVLVETHEWSLALDTFGGRMERRWVGPMPGPETGSARIVSLNLWVNTLNPSTLTWFHKGIPCG